MGENVVPLTAIAGREPEPDGAALAAHLRQWAKMVEEEGGIYTRAVIVLDGERLEVIGSGCEPMEGIGILTLGIRQLQDGLIE